MSEVAVDMQILGNLYPHYPNKAQKAVSHFKDAATRSDKDPEIWEMLGELLAPNNPSGGCQMPQTLLLALLQIPLNTVG